MPRKPRHFVPNTPCHLVQRGNNRQPVFFSDEDYRFYLECLSEAAAKYVVQIHAYVLMTNHVHLLATGAHEDSLSRMMQSVGRRYVRFINATYQRTGTLWEGRFKSSLIDSDNYLLVCYRYIELNPVRACMVHSPGEYRWSSYRVHANGEVSRLISDHEVYLRLGKDEAQRQHAYRALFRNALDPATLHLVSEAAQLGVPLGNDRFKAEIDRVLGYQISYRRPGRPPKEAMGFMDKY